MPIAGYELANKTAKTNKGVKSPLLVKEIKRSKEIIIKSKTE